MSAQIYRALSALDCLAAAWRGDWSDFDGRQLRDQLHSWEALLRRALAGELRDDEENDWLRTECICPVCRSWREWCNNHAEHFAAAGRGVQQDTDTEAER